MCFPKLVVLYYGLTQHDDTLNAGRYFGVGI